jgi:DNA-binding IclR family transcriptional regulator
MTRAEDEALLDMLERRRQGQSHAAIARAHGINSTTVSRRISRLVSDDCAHDPDAIRYWRNTGDPE